MKTVIKNLIMVAALLLLATGCTQSLTKEGYMRKYQSWITSLEHDYKNYKDDDWRHAEADFRMYSETEYNRFKDDFSPQERKQVDQLTGQYYAVLAKYKTHEVTEELKSMIDNAQGMLNELKKP